MVCKRLDGKIVIITGAVGLIGSAFSRAVAAEGGKVILADIDQGRGERLEQELVKDYGEGIALFCAMDITDKASIDAAVEKGVARYGRIDGLVNNAYPRNKNYGRPFDEVEYKDLCENIAMHLGGFFLVSQCLCRYFVKAGGGNIVNIASIYGVIPPRFDIYDGTEMTMPVEYALIKSAVIQLTRYMAKYFKGHNIRFNAISPGGVFNAQPESFVERYNNYCLNKGMLDSEDLCGSLVFLLSDESKCINGQNIIVDDGFTL